MAKEEDPKPSHQLYKLQIKSTLPLGFNCGFIYISTLGHPLGFAPEAALEDLGLPL